MLLLPGELNTKFLAHKNGTFERGISTQSLVALFQANFFQRSKKKKKTFKMFTFNINSLHQKCGHILFSTDYIYRWATARKERQNLKGSH